jgi:hypothetical protein
MFDTAFAKNHENKRLTKIKGFTVFRLKKTCHSDRGKKFLKCKMHGVNVMVMN